MGSICSRSENTEIVKKGNNIKTIKTIKTIKMYPDIVYPDSDSDKYLEESEKKGNE